MNPDENDASDGSSMIEDFASKVIDWPFLDEPLYRWAIFIVALGAFTTAWGGVLRYMRSKE